MPAPARDSTHHKRAQLSELELVAAVLSHPTYGPDGGRQKLQRSIPDLNPDQFLIAVIHFRQTGHCLYRVGAQVIVGGLDGRSQTDQDLSLLHDDLHYSSTFTTWRPLYMPQLGHTRWGAFGLWQYEHSLTLGALPACVARRASLRAREVFFLGTAIFCLAIDR
jgi:hypothetical protein